MAGIIPLIVAVALTAAAPQPPPRAHADAPVLCVKEEDCPQPDTSPRAAQSGLKHPSLEPTPSLESTRIMKKIVLTLGLAALLGAGGAFASGDHAAHGAGASAAIPASAPTPAADPVTEGEVRKVDREQGKITLKHGEIRNLDMPGMTMVFRVKDAALFDKVKEGDKVGFTAEKIGGQFTVTGIEKK